jgi:TBC1 domain family member 25
MYFVGCLLSHLVNLFFTYRWLLLECKREFPFNDALRVLEVMWATLPIDNEAPVLSELVLLTSPSDNMIADILYATPDPTLRSRANSCPQLTIAVESTDRKYHFRSPSLPCANDDRFTLSVKTLSSQNDVRTKVEHEEHRSHTVNTKNRHSNSNESQSNDQNLGNSLSLGEISDVDPSTLSACSTANNMTSSHNISQFLLTTDWLQRLPTGDTMWLTEENAFLLFLCISLLLTHRNYLLKQKNLDEQEISMHFDRYRRRHNGERILHCARTLYDQYTEWIRKKRLIDEVNQFSGS